MQILQTFYAYAKEYASGSRTAREIILCERRLYDENCRRDPYRLDTALQRSILGQFEQLNENGGDEAIADRLIREFIDVMEGRRVFRSEGTMCLYLTERAFSGEQREILDIASDISRNNRRLTVEEFYRVRPYMTAHAAESVPDLLTETIAAYLRVEYLGVTHEGNPLPHLLAMAHGAPVYLYMSYTPEKFCVVIL